MDTHIPEPGPVNPCFALMTPRQIQILRLLCKGYTYKQIAYELKGNQGTIKNHISNMLHISGAENSNRLCYLAGLEGLHDNIDTDTETIQCPYCGGTFAVDGTYLEQVSLNVNCPMCNSTVSFPEV